MVRAVIVLFALALAGCGSQPEPPAGCATFREAVRGFRAGQLTDVEFVDAVTAAGIESEGTEVDPLIQEFLAVLAFGDRSEQDEVLDSIADVCDVGGVEVK